VLFTQGGASLQFAAIPMNLIGRKGCNGKPYYLVTGAWSQKALAEVRKYGDAEVVCDGNASNYSSIPASDSWKPIDPNAPYIYYCDNETVHGI
jgi:phosphoserine aminotransferase